MIQIPQKILMPFESILGQREIPKNYHLNYKKWLRYYLDFCYKYQHNPSNKISLPHFINKLQDKKQSVQQQKQASDAVSLYYEIALIHSSNHKSQGKNKETSSTKKVGLQLANADWTSVYNDLDSEIKIRHYSPKTLRAYRGWVRQFQNFTMSKDPGLLSSSEVKDFLTFLAVKRKVSASSQNQAFNALLFLFRHIIKKEFGDMKDIPRAKRKPYIPVVLSRDEIDAITIPLSYPYDLVVKLLYGCGLRLFECMNLRVGCLNFDAGILTVHDGKGKKDRKGN